MFQTFSSYLVMLLLFGLMVLPDHRWPLRSSEVKAYVAFAVITLAVVAGGNAVALKWSWIDRLLLLLFLWVAAWLWMPALVR